MSFLNGKRALIVGVASNRSIAYGIAKALHREGAELAFNYQTEKLEGRVKKMAGEFESDIVLPLDVGEDANIENFFDSLAGHWQHFDILIHSVAFAPADQLAGRFVDSVSREGFREMYPEVDAFRDVKARVDPNGRFSSSLARRLGIAEAP